MVARPSEIGAAGAHAGRAVARLREGRGWDQREMTARLAATGRPLSQPVLSRIEAGTRRLDVDDLVALAEVLRVAVSALLPPETRHPGAEVVVFPGGPADDDGEAGPVQAALTDDISALGDLTGMEPTLAEVAQRLARQMDGLRPVPCDECGAMVHVPTDPRILPQLARELRATVAALLEGRAVDDDDDDDLSDLGSV
ncbi:helix-turn-helix domain-containing protein [Streptomyces sp. NPDC001780]